jgi:xylulose-5-phosphate/fructose-6-phosphate phosphoketolase
LQTSTRARCLPFTAFRGTSNTESPNSGTGISQSLVRGYKEEGTTTTPFDMAVLNDIDRFHLVGDVIDRLPSLGSRAAYATQAVRDKLIDHKNYIRR